MSVFKVYFVLIILILMSIFLSMSEISLTPQGRLATDNDRRGDENVKSIEGTGNFRKLFTAIQIE